jgi:hypothetical protein
MAFIVASPIANISELIYCRSRGQNRFGILLFVTLAALLQQLGNESGPAGLVVRPHSFSCIAVEVFMEQDQVLPVWIILELIHLSECWTTTVCIAKENPAQPPR